MHITGKLYITLAISFLLLFFSLLFAYKNIHSSNDMIDYIKRDQIKLSNLVHKLNYDIKVNQSNILQSIILKKNLHVDEMHASLQNLSDIVFELEKFVQSSKIKIDAINETVYTIKKRIIGYRAVEDSLIEAVQSADDEDIQDALIGFNHITVKFSEDIEKLLNLSNTNLYENVSLLQEENNKGSTVLIFSFLMATVLISFSIYKFTLLHTELRMELDRAEKAEEEQNKLQLKLAKYNDDLESEIEKKSQELYQKIYANSISGLPNRNKLLEDSQLYNFKKIALLNIDKFQKFNDVYGEKTGNIAIKLSAEFLNMQLNNINLTLYHVGGDEFAIISEELNSFSNNNFVKTIETILENYKHKHFVYEDKKFNFIMSAGIAFGGGQKILSYSDMALKDAKRRNIQLAIFNHDKGLEKTHKQDMECHKELVKALQNDNILSFFQPIIPIQDANKSTKYESLVRLKQESGKIISPFNFINVAKQNRIYDKITQAVVNNTLNTIEKYKIPASINLSIVDIENTQTLDMLFNKFDDFDYNYLLTIELLETEEFSDYEAVYTFCVKIRSYGIKIALDDFGSGYANFAHILNLPVDFIKIDASLISNIDRNTQSQIMVETIVGLAKKLHVETIAEFVSSKEILDVIRELKVDYAQGFHIGKPEPIENHLEEKLI